MDGGYQSHLKRSEPVRPPRGHITSSSLKPIKPGPNLMLRFGRSGFREGVHGEVLRRRRRQALSQEAEAGSRIRRGESG